jgi:putative addiction module component (TIGR02574 family)
MTPELRAALFALSVEEKLELIGELWDSIDEESLPPPPQWQIDELARREAYLRENPTSLRTWEQVLERIRNRHGR